jgi:hypothetical protein
VGVGVGVGEGVAVAPGAVSFSPTRTHQVMWRFWIRNATWASSPCSAHAPAPGRSVWRKIPTTKSSAPRRVRISFPPHRSPRLNALTASRERRTEAVGESLTTRLGTAK